MLLTELDSFNGLEMTKSGKIDGPVFQTFDTASVNYKTTKLEIQPRDRENILRYVQTSPKPVLAGTISLWFDLRMNYLLSILDDLLDKRRIVKVSHDDLKAHGLSEHAEAFWVSEKIR